MLSLLYIIILPLPTCSGECYAVQAGSHNACIFPIFWRSFQPYNASNHHNPFPAAPRETARRYYMGHLLIHTLYYMERSTYISDVPQNVHKVTHNSIHINRICRHCMQKFSLLPYCSWFEMKCCIKMWQHTR